MQNMQITRDAQREEINILFREIMPIYHGSDIDGADEANDLPITRNVIRGRCLCGKYVTRQNMPRHIKSLQHRTYILANPDIRETRRAWNAFVASEELTVPVHAEIEEAVAQRLIIIRRRDNIPNADEPAE